MAITKGACMELHELKQKIEQLKSQDPTKRPYYPAYIWDEISTLAKTIPPHALASELGLSAPNLVRQIKKRQREMNDCKDSLEKSTVVEVPQALIASTAKQLSLELPHGIVLKIDL